MLQNLVAYGMSHGMQRTVKLMLQPTPAQAQALTDTTQQFTRAFNDVCAYGWAHTEKNGVRLHHATYYTEKARLPWAGG